MSRRTFERRSRLENQKEIVRVRDAFRGEASDLPGNAIGLKSQAQLVNQLCYESYLQSRGGVNTGIQGDLKSIPMLPETVVPTATFIQSGTQVMCHGYPGSSADIGKFIVYSTIEGAVTYPIVRIVGNPNCGIFTVDRSQSVSSAHYGIIRHRLNCMYYDAVTGMWVVHVGPNLYKMPQSTFAWQQIYPVGSHSIPDSPSQISSDGDNLVAICAAKLTGATPDTSFGIWSIGINDNLYYPMNIDALPNAVTFDNKFNPQAEGGYNRNYLVTQTRLSNQGSGANIVTADRFTADIKLEHETGSWLLSDQADYSTLGYGLPTGNPYASNLPTQTLNVVTFQPNLSAFSAGITLAAFDWYYDDGSGVKTKKHVNFAIPVLTTLTALAAALRAAVQESMPEALIDEPAGAFNGNYNPTSGYLAIELPEAYTMYWGYGQAYLGETNVTGAGYMNSEKGDAGVSRLSSYIPAPKTLKNITGMADPITHYSVYATQDISDKIANSDPTAYAWLDDIVIMKAFNGTLTPAVMGTVGVSNTYKLTADQSVYPQENFQQKDVGRKIWLIISDGAGGYNVLGATVDNYVSSSILIIDCQSQPFTTGTKQVIGAIGAKIILSGISKSTDPHTGAFLFSYANCFNIPAWEALSNNYGPIYSTTVQLNNGEQIFYDYGTIGVIENSLSFTSYTMVTDPGTGGPNVVTVAAARQSLDGAEYTDIYSDSDLSPRIGSIGLKTRFMRGIPYDPAWSFTGIVVPGFLICGNGESYYYSELPLGYKYLGGNYNPAYQQDKMTGVITAFSRHPDVVGIYSAHKTGQIQLNMAIDNQDASNGMIIRSLPSVKIVDESRGCIGIGYLCETESGACAVRLSDGNLSLFNGYTFGENLEQDQINKKTRTLYNQTVDYDLQYGLLVRGSILQDSYNNDKMYYVDCSNNELIGCGQLSDLPLGEQGVHFVKYNGTSYIYNPLMISKGTETVWRLIPGYTAYFDYVAQQDTYPLYQSGVFDIASIHVTSDDTGDMQHYFLEDMEGHIFLSPYKESDQTYLNALQMTVTAYSDIASPVTLEAQVSNNNDINYDVKVRGHRIRHKYTFDRAGWIMNGLVEYYKSTDSRTKNNSKDYEKAIQDVLANPIYGISIYEKHYNIAIDKAVVGSDFFGAEVDPIQMVVIPVLPGPDGKHMGLMFGYLQYCVKSDPIKAVLYGPWTFNFWIYTGGGCGGLGMIFKLIPYAEGMITSNQLRFDQSGYVAMTSEYGADSGHLPVPSDGNWHFVSISYLGANHALLGQVDMGAVIQLEAAGGDWGNKFLLGTDTGVDYPIISSINPIFDIRVFNIGLSQAQLNYYYQDVLAGGARTLPLV